MGVTSSKKCYTKNQSKRAIRKSKSAIGQQKIEYFIEINGSSTCPIFKLNIDCFDEIFDYLSLNDLCSFGETCQKMQQVAGQYFKSNYGNATTYCSTYRMYTIHCHDNGWAKDLANTMCFNKFITYLVIGTAGENIAVHTDTSQPLTYIKSNLIELMSLNHLSFIAFNLIKEDFYGIHPILNQIEILTLRQCSLKGDLYKDVLKFCRNLKRLNVQDYLGWFGKTTNEQSWLSREYPMLHHFKLVHGWNYRIGDLGAFFRKNRNIQTFSTDSKCLLEYKSELIKCMPQLDELTVRAFNMEQTTTLESIMDLLMEFNDRNLYKKLHISINSLDQSIKNHLVKLQKLKSLSIRSYNRFYGLPQLIELKELSILQIENELDAEHLADSLTDLEQFSIFNATIKNIAPFIRRSRELKTIKIAFKNEFQFKGEHFKLKELNKERGQLLGARKLTIYVPNRVFMAMKWATKNGDLNLNYIEIRRSDSQFLDIDFLK